MSENSQELFRKTLQEFKAADALFSQQMLSSESDASTAHNEITKKAETAEQIADLSTKVGELTQLVRDLSSENATLKSRLAPAAAVKG